MSDSEGWFELGLYSILTEEEEVLWRSDKTKKKVFDFL